MIELEFPQPADLSDDYMQRLVKQFTRQELRLPALSTTAARLQEMVERPEADPQDVAALVQTDQSLSSHVLRVANSVAFAPEVRIESVPQAIARLGMRAMGEMAVALMARDQLFGPLMHESQLVRGMWQHAAVAGIYARRVAVLLRSDRHATILTGLLADVGKPVTFKLLVDLSEELSEPLDADTRDYLIEALHVPLGTLLARAWRLPEPVVAAIAYHHDYLAAPEHRQAAMTAYLADKLAQWCLQPQTREEQDVRDLQVIRDLGFDPGELGVLFGDPEQALQAAAVFA